MSVQSHQMSDMLGNHTHLITFTWLLSGGILNWGGIKKTYTHTQTHTHTHRHTDTHRHTLL